MMPSGFSSPAAMVLAFTLAMLTGCGELPSISGVGASSEVAKATGLSLSPEEVAQSGPVTPISPFGDVSAAPPGGREVIASPTFTDVMQPVAGADEVAFGSPDAPVTLVQYASLTCPFCKRFHAEVYPSLKRDYIDTGKVRYILRDFPIGRTSGQASIALRCAPRDRYLDLYRRFLEQQPAWVSQEVRPDAIYAIAAQVGMARADFDACRNSVPLVESIKATKDRGRKLGIIGTPNFFIQDKLVRKTLDGAELYAMLDAAANQRTARAP